METTGKPRNRLAFWGGVFSFFAPLTGYLLTLGPWIYWRDSPELAMVPFLLDIAHPPGAPAYTLLGKIATLLPLGNVAMRVNLMTAVFGAAASLAVYALVWCLGDAVFDLRNDARWRAPLLTAVAASAAGLVAFAPSFWYWAVVAEVYTLATAAAAAVLLLAVRYLALWETDRDAAVRRALLAALVFGLGTGIHPNLIVMAPAVLLLFLVARSTRLTGRDAIHWLAMLALGCSVYVLLPVRSSTPLVYDYGNPETLGALFAHLTGQSYSPKLYHTPWPETLSHWAGVPVMVVGQLGWAALVFGLVGIAVLFIRNRPLAAALVLTALGNMWLVKDWVEAFGYIPTLTVWIVFAGVGAVAAGAFVLRRLAASGVELAGRGFSAVLLLGALVLVLSHMHASWDRADKSGHVLAAKHGKAVLDPLAEEAVLVSSGDHVSYTLHYLQYVENYRPDVAHVHAAYLPYTGALQERWPHIDWSRSEGDESPMAPLLRQMDRYPLFIDRTRFTVGLVPDEELAPFGIVYRVLDEPAAKLSPTGIARHFEIVQRYHRPILEDPWFNEHDWTAHELYTSIENEWGEFFFKRGYPGLAEVAFLEARRISPGDPDAFYNLGSLYIAQGQYDRARGILEAGLAIDPESPDLLANLALVAERTGEPDTAAARYAEALDADPSRDRVRYSLANLLGARGQGDAAAKHYRRLWKKSADPALAVNAGLRLAAHVADQGKTRKAKKILEQILERVPDHPAATGLLHRIENPPTANDQEPGPETTR